MPVAAAVDRLVVILIRPSKYDDEGYVIRHFRGTLPSNTLSCLNSLTEDAVRHGALGDVEVRLEVIDEIVSKVSPSRLARRHRRPGTRVLVGLVGVQTNQFPRAQDLARQFLAEGCEVMIGGFHVSGAIAMASAIPPECQAMIDAGVTLVLGEVENHWADVLKDVVAGTRKPLYDFLESRPDLNGAPLPRASFKTQKKFMLRESGTIDAGRGCVFNCSFCTIINVQGRTMRARGAGPILDQIRQNYRLKGRRGIRHYFFTDDNFTRNPYWEAIFDGLIAMREAEGIHIDFMMQVDTQAPRVPHFIEKAARAGCVQVFIGMEAIRDDNLKAGGKPQNKSREYRDMIARWHAVGVVCHVGFIIGFPHDTYDRVMEDVRTLRDTLLVDQASFFMLTPLPGSRDHQVAVGAGVPMDDDYNNFDSFHATTPHPLMSAEEWHRAFRDAWREFYSFEHMRRSLLRQNPHTYWAVLKNFIWYRAAMSEGAHPMITGFFRLKDRRSRRAGFPIEGRARFFVRRVREVSYTLREYAKIFLEMEELWLKTRIRREQYAFLGDLRNVARRSTEEVKLNWGRVHTAMDAGVVALRSSVGQTVQSVSETMAERLDAVREAVGQWATGIVPARTAETAPASRPNRLRQALARVNVLSLTHLNARRDHLREYWQQVWHAAWRFQFWRVNPLSLAVNLLGDARRTVLFFYAMMLERY